MLNKVVTALAFGGVLFSLAPVVDAYSSDQYTFSAAVTSAELVGSKPVPTEVVWVQSITAEDGDEVTLDHFEVVVLEDGEEIGSVEAAASDRSVVLNKVNIPALKVFTDYEVRVDEYYTDSSSSEGFAYAFHTAPPKLKNLRAIDKLVADDGSMTVTLKWRQPTNLKNDYIYYDYKIAKPNASSSLVEEDYEWGIDVDSTTVTDLPRQKLKFRVRARDDQNGSGPWSAWKVFNAPEL